MNVAEPQDPFENGVSFGGKSVPPKEMFNPEGMSFVTPRDIIGNRFQSPMQPKAGRMPPQALEMEEAVLGALMLESGAWARAETVLKPEMLYKEGHKIIYKGMAELVEAKDPIDLLTLKNHLSKSGTLEVVGGIYYLTELTSKIASAANIEYHCRVIAQKYLLRELIKIGDGIVQAGYDDTTDVFDLLAESQIKLGTLDSTNKGSGGMYFDVAVACAEEQLELLDKGDMVFLPALPFMPGYSFAAGEVVAVGADSGIGKTSIGMQWALESARMGIPTLFNTLEMTPEQLAMREMAMAIGVDGFRMRQGGLTRDQWQSWGHLKQTKRLKIIQRWTAKELISAVVEYRKELGLPPDAVVMVVNDYIQLMLGKGATKEERLSTISGDLKQAALEGKFLLVHLAQLNREWMKSAGEKKPTVHNIRDCDKIRHDADYVFLAHVPERYTSEPTDSDGDSLKGAGLFIIGKSRIGFLNGKFEIKTMIHNGKWMTFDAYRQIATSPHVDIFPDPKRVNPNREEETNWDFPM